MSGLGNGGGRRALGPPSPAPLQICAANGGRAVALSRPMIWPTHCWRAPSRSVRAPFITSVTLAGRHVVDRRAHPLDSFAALTALRSCVPWLRLTVIMQIGLELARFLFGRDLTFERQPAGGPAATPGPPCARPRPARVGPTGAPVG